MAEAALHQRLGTVVAAEAAAWWQCGSSSGSVAAVAAWRQRWRQRRQQLGSGAAAAAAAWRLRAGVLLHHRRGIRGGSLFTILAFERFGRSLLVALGRLGIFLKVREEGLKNYF